MTNPYMDKFEAFAAEMRYDEFVQCCILMLQERDHYLEMIWKEDAVIYISSYDTTVPGGGRELSVIPAEDGPAVTEQDVLAAHPEYRQDGCSVDIHLYQDMDHRCAVFFFFASAEIFRVPPALQEKKAAVDSVLLPLLYVYQREQKRAGESNDGTIGLLVENIRFLHTWCVDHHLQGHFRDFYRYCIYRTVEIWGADSLRGDYDAQRIVSKAIGYLCEASCTVEIILWDLDSGFEVLYRNISGLVEKGKVRVKKRAIGMDGIFLSHEQLYKFSR